MKLLSNQISPHFKLTDSLHAVVSLFGGSFNKRLDSRLSKALQASETDPQNIVFTNTARSALGLICDTVRPAPGKRIGIPAFVCAVVATPFLARGYQIEWIDTDSNGLIDPKDFEAKAKNISLVVVPHIFGQASPLKQIVEIAKQHDIFVIEDSAHLIRQFGVFPKLSHNFFDLPKDRSLKNLQVADAQILSFGREKVISCVSGGALLWPQNSVYQKDFKKLKTTLKPPRLSWIVRHAIQPLIFCLSLPWWHKGGKVLPWLCRRLNLLPLAVSKAEKNGAEDVPIAHMGLPQKRILARQLKLWDNRQLHAQAMALAWKQALEPLFPDIKLVIPPLAFRTLIKFNHPAQKQNFLKALSLHCPQLHTDDWTGIPISPKGINYNHFGYRPGQCKNAEYFARTYLTLPTNIKINKADIKRIAQTLSSL